ncbi:MAG: HNH endonuclease [Candidatus Margulisiibacteriota bacterium]
MSNPLSNEEKEKTKAWAEMYAQGASLGKLSVMINVPISTIRYRLHKMGVLRTLSEANKLSFALGRDRGIGRKCPPRRPESLEKYRIAAQKRWKDKQVRGTRITSQGYVEFTTGEHKGKMVHRVLIENLLGRKLSTTEVVHHLNENKTDNRIENLKLINPSKHRLIHLQSLELERDSRGRIKNTRRTNAESM